MHAEPVAASSAASDTARRYLSYESTDSYGPIEVTDGEIFKIVCALFSRLCMHRDTFRIKIYRSWEYLCFKFVWRWRWVPGVGCFRFRGFAPVAGPNCGGVRPYKATPWVTLVVYPTMCGWSVS